MIALFIILYVTGIWLFYIKMKVKPTPVNLAVSAVIGIVAVGAIVIFWQFSAPTTSQLVVTRHTIQIVPQVKGHIAKIEAKPNVPLIKGKDILFEIQKNPFQFAVNQSKAAVSAAEKTVEQLQAGLKVADATIQESMASLEAAKADLAAKEDANERSPGAVSALELTELRAKVAASEAGVDKSNAAKEVSAFSLQTAQQQVALAEAQLDTTQFNLEQCTYYAPADGFVTNWQVREGAMAVPLPFSPMGTFVDTSDVDVVGVFSQNVLKNVASGDRVEVALKNHPGQVFTGTVDSVIQGSGEGQFVTSGKLLDAASVHSSGKFAVKIALDDRELAKTLPMGTAGMATIYTQKGKPFQIISTVTVRIKAWMYYLLPM
ncbi:HlyD family secretion protein [Bremerella alba]|uniref:Inner membrane protein YiaV n=1 Tax=Bremerella alba TaxID=980252 RepID=A0A7V8V8S9_9BACT|nr:efflux RND transporter periplasmic adaptor subunit [Bremerella alba]MBA2117033.1 Inner membrane protein YiaV [Bremerella alba]